MSITNQPQHFLEQILSLCVVVVLWYLYSMYMYEYSFLGRKEIPLVLVLYMYEYSFPGRKEIPLVLVLYMYEYSFLGRKEIPLH